MKYTATARFIFLRYFVRRRFVA